MITQRFRDFKTTCIILLHPISQHNPIVSKREIPHVKIQSCIRGFHVYKEVWTPVMKEILTCSRESKNLHDPFAVKVFKSEIIAIIGYMSRNISSVCSLFFE